MPIEMLGYVIDRTVISRPKPTPIERVYAFDADVGNEFLDDLE